MLHRDPWLLPDGVEEILPDDAKHLEKLRRKLLDVFSSWGYELVITPLIDYLDSLLTGAGHDLDLQTFKLTDQLSGEMLGIRADMTPQVARIDAHNLKHDRPTRLCYVGTTLHTLGDQLEQTRSPMQIGAELYGHAGIESDTEVIQLMLEMLAICGLKNVHLDLGHVGVFRELSQQAKLSVQQESDLFDILQRKARAEFNELINSLPIDQALKPMFLILPELNGGREVLDKARTVLTMENQVVKQALADLQHIADQLSVCFPALPVSFDLAELRGYHYHTGTVFATFIPAVGKEIARGGRYDNIGAVFGRSRPATGFSADLKILSALKKGMGQEEENEIIFAPFTEDAELAEIVRDLRAQGRCVIQQLPEQSGDARQMGCTASIEKSEHGWVIN